MMVNIFLLFPDDIDVYEIASRGLEDEIRISLINLKKHLRETGIQFCFCYSSNELQTYLDTLSILSDGEKVVNRMTTIKSVLSRHSMDVSIHNIANPQHVYAEWNLSVPTLIDNQISVTMQNLCCFENSSVLSFCPSDESRPEIDIIEDAVNDSSLPRLLRVPVFICPDDCVEWIKSLTQGSFSIFNKADFSPTSYHWGNQRIFLQKSSGNYWYLDFFHIANGHPHYEVFDPTGNHLYEADKDTGGKIPNSQDPKKSISHILHGKS